MTQQMKFPSNDEIPFSGPASRSIRLQLLDGTPHGLIIADIVNWTGRVLSAPRGRIAGLLRRPEAARTGVYLLTGADPDRAGGIRAYIGETDDVAERLRYHLRIAEKDFFERAAIIVAKDELLTKSHARFLESQLLRIANDAEGVALENTTMPNFRILPEADRLDMENFIAQLRLVLPILGFDLFRHADRSSLTNEPRGGPIFTFATAGAAARARETEDRFVVQAGSTARKGGTVTFPANWRSLRDTLVQDGRLIEDSNPELYQFAEDVPFSSPSAAAAVVAARSASGPREWKVEGTGQAYRDWRAQWLDEA